VWLDRRHPAASAPALAVAIHDVEPATFERCALIRDWLGDHDVARVTLLVTPAPDLHPFHDSRPELARWLAERVHAGDAVAQHGLQHLRAASGREFAGLDRDDTRRAVEAGRRVLRLAGVEPRGFVAPAYAYTAELRATVARSFDWWASLGRLHRAGTRDSTLAPALRLGTMSVATRMTSPWFVRAGALAAGPLLRLDLHPADLDHPQHIGAVEGVLRRARGRLALTYDDLA